MSITKKLPLILYHLLFLIIILTNLVPNGKWFIGWDSINSELNSSLNITRSLFATWEENYGLGTLGGHGFAAILPYSLITGFLSIFLSPNLIRPIFTFICYYFGGLGMYFLVKKLLSFISDNKFIPYIALTSSLFYLFNLATTLSFSVQLESFIVQFASLPWLFWIIIKLISSPFSRKNIFLFCLINFFASIQGFIPQLFVVYFIAILIFLLTYVTHHRFSLITIKRGLLILFLTLTINAYWLLPFGYFSLTRSSLTSQSYNNIISTPDFVEKSKKFGTIDNVMLLKGPYWDDYQLGEYISKPLRDHHQNPIVPVIGYSFFALSIIGLIVSFTKFKNHLFSGFSLIFIYLFTSLSLNSPPFSYINHFIELISPAYHQAFRVPFTKMGIGAGFTMSILISLGLLFLIQIKKNLNLNKVIICLFLFSTVFYNLPIFQGNLIFKKMYVDLPQSYLEIINYFKTQPDGRIADMPQSCAEGWYSYKWGYFGSGFYWYGIKQPFLSRSFDVWSQNNENYYWEISQAFRQQNFTAIDQIFEKYNVDWVLYDQNLLHCSNQNTFIDQDKILNFFNQNPNYKLIKTFSDKNILPINLYQRKNSSNNFISLSSNPTNIGPIYDYSDNDPVKNYPYISDAKDKYHQYFPFRNLFTKRSSQNKNFKISLSNDSIIFSTKLEPGLQGYKLDQNFLADNYLPVSINIQKKDSNKYEVFLNIQTPTITVDKNIISQELNPIKLGEFKTFSSLPIQVIINNVSINFDGQPIPSIFYINTPNTLKITNGKTQLFSWTKANSSSLVLSIDNLSPIIPSYKNGDLEVIIPNSSKNKVEASLNNTKPQLCNDINLISAENKYEINESQNPKYIRLISQNTKQCLNLTIDNINTNYSYLANVITRHQQGQNLFLHITNKGRPTGTDVYLQSSKKFDNEFIIIPSNIPNEIEYNFNFESKSFNQNLTINDINSIQLYLIPYYYLNNLKLSLNQDSTETTNSLVTIPNGVQHSNETSYKVNISTQDNNKWLILYQSYNPEWLAFYFQNGIPIFLKNHVLANNWANAWLVRQDYEVVGGELPDIYIFFWPQIFEYLGLVITATTLVLVFKKPKNK